MNGLPKGWTTVSVEKLAGPSGFVTDGDWVESKDQDANGTVRLIQLADVGVNEFRDRSSRFLTPETALELRCSFLEKGDVLIARMPDPIGRACVFPGLRQDAVTVVDVMLWRSDQTLAEPTWLTRIMNSTEIRTTIVGEAGGTTRQRISGGRLKSLELPTPPLPEQRRIVAKLDALDARAKRARADLDRIPALVARAKQAILAKAFRGELTADWRISASAMAPSYNDTAIEVESKRHDAWVIWAAEQGTRRAYKPAQGWDWKPDFELPAGWHWFSVDQLCAASQYGSSSKTDEDQLGVPVLRMGNIQVGALDFSNLKFLPAAHNEFPELLLKAGDVLFNRTNSAELVGKTAVFNGYSKPCSFASYLIRLRAAAYSPTLLSAYINSDIGRSWVGSVVSQQVGQANVNGTKLAGLAVPFMPENEQAEIVRRIESAFAKIDRIAADAASASKLLGRLDQAILTKAFRGELVPQNPEDEPASILLERIRATTKTAPRKGRGRKV